MKGDDGEETVDVAFLSVLVQIVVEVHLGDYGGGLFESEDVLRLANEIRDVVDGREGRGGRVAENVVASSAGATSVDILERGLRGAAIGVRLCEVAVVIVP